MVAVVVVPTTGEPAVVPQLGAVRLGVVLVKAYEQLFVVVVVVEPEVLVVPTGQVKPPLSEPDVTAVLAAPELA